MDEEEFNEAMGRAIKKAAEKGLQPSEVIDCFVSAIALTEPILRVVLLGRELGTPVEAIVHTIRKVWEHKDAQEKAALDAAEALEKVKGESRG
jgi:hypothetical protein